MIDFKDITIVIQGAVSKEYTKKCLESIREHLPNSTIILSTWKDTDVLQLAGLYDKVIFNEDPGFTYCTTEENLKLNNVNRQIVSSFAGIKEAQTKYVLKFRTDFCLTGNKFLKYFDKYRSFNDRLKNVSKKILSCTIYSINPENKNIESYNMHPSDFMFFGLKEDLYNLFNIPLMNDKEAFFFKEQPMTNSKILYQYSPEQYIWIKFLKYEKLKHLFDVNKQTIEDTNISFANNLVLLSPKQLNIKPFKKSMLSGLVLDCYTHFDWLKIYFKYCRNNMSIKSNLRIIITIFCNFILCNPIFSIEEIGLRFIIRILFLNITIKLKG